MPGVQGPGNRDKTGQFKPGASGNPNGRPKVAEEFKAKCREFSPEVFEAWRSEVVRRGDNWLKASELLAAYGFGKPAQSVDVTSNGEPLSFRIERAK